jgi:hypothetical protein
VPGRCMPLNVLALTGRTGWPDCVGWPAGLRESLLALDGYGREEDGRGRVSYPIDFSSGCLAGEI